MHIHFLDPYRPIQSSIHSLDPRIKFILAVAFILTTSLTPFTAWPVYIFLLTLVISIGILSDLGIGYIMKRSLLALPFLLAAFPVIFTIKGRLFLTFRLDHGYLQHHMKDWSVSLA